MRSEPYAICWGCLLRVPARLTSRQRSVWGTIGDYCAECWPDLSRVQSLRHADRCEVARLRTHAWAEREAEVPR